MTLYPENPIYDSLLKKDERKIELEIFSDEINPVQDETDKSKWIYIGVLFVPLEKKEAFISELKNLRCINNSFWHDSNGVCPVNCVYHDKNNTEIHYKELHKSDARFRVAKRWIGFLKNPTNVEKYIWFNVLGINLSNLDHDNFGDGSEIQYFTKNPHHLIHST